MKDFANKIATLVATRGIKVSRRDFLNVNVISTCDNIMNYVLARVPPPQPGLPLPRFSLYLSSQLQYGLIVVYHRQCALLLEELQSILEQFFKQKNAKKHDLDDHKKQAVTFPDALSLMEEAEAAPDPLFGVMYMQGLMPSPRRMIETSRESFRKSSPELSDSATSSSDITASPDSITLSETEPVILPAEFEGEDLPTAQQDDLDFLMSQPDFFTEESAEFPRAKEESVEKERSKELTGSTTKLQPTTISSEDVTALPQPEFISSEEQPAAVPLTPVAAPAISSPPSALRGRERRQRRPDEEDVSPEVETRTKRRRRQLVFLDPVTQLSAEDQQRQINNPLTETRGLVYPQPPWICPASELLDNPCNDLPREIEFVWRQAAIIRPFSGPEPPVGERGPESSESEEMMMITEEADGQAQSVELSSREVQREMLEQEMLRLSVMGKVPLEVSDREISREISPLLTSEREGSTVSRPVSVLQDIPEGVDEQREEEAVETPRSSPELPQPQEPVTFQMVLPADADRRTVSSIFLKLLVNVSAKNLRVEQDEPYRDIVVFPG